MIGHQPSGPNSAPIAWTIAGSDSGAGAGIQADLKVMNAFGVHGCTVITALTAQNSIGVHSAESVSPEMFQSQLDALNTDLPAGAIKTGMLGSAANCRMLAAHLSSHPPHPPLICDPVLKSTSGTDLLDPEAVETLTQKIFPHVTILTPNLPEAETLLRKPVSSIENSAAQLLAMGARSVLIKGGHAAGGHCSDYWTNGNESMWLTSPRIETRATHGTGCILSSAIAAGIALGNSVAGAVIDAKTFLNQCLRSPAGIGGGHGPMRITPFINAPEDRPTIT